LTDRNVRTDQANNEVKAQPSWRT